MKIGLVLLILLDTLLFPFHGPVGFLWPLACLLLFLGAMSWSPAQYAAPIFVLIAILGFVPADILIGKFSRPDPFVGSMDFPIDLVAVRGVIFLAGFAGEWLFNTVRKRLVQRTP